ncbi:uncharacterized protein RMCC_0632 [Mycolicibacterium canariasense]|uniref:Uncharacterized protein n=1 Tax=Mycolicibacterium canariasense TaxID=228230 RepID=A0A100W8T9_MYCCR|nr:helix-turn-helix domain-containing protein [Mycolicibacterium canariasense]MCV7207473.1 helix-turn-helix domain-containing protein [Mycolicibacterium canariasense]ORV08718.1 hypothetical protein AWB94_10905 [Mycolicibacterium canariasense]GAS93666.1 uncharacterized protein RMCC_0632 [Mycolicibacterium canariasense]
MTRGADGHGDWIRALHADVCGVQRSHAPRAAAAAVPVLGEPLTAWGIELAARVHDKVRVELPDANLSAGGYASAAVEASVLALLTGLVTGRAFATPAEARDHVRWSARQGMALDTVLRVIWQSHTGAQDQLVDAMTKAVPAEQLAYEVKRVSSRLLETVTTMVGDLSVVFEHERTAWGRHRSATIRHHIDCLVETGQLRAGAEAELGIRLGDHHVAALLWPVGAAIDRGWTADIPAWGEMVRGKLNAATTLVMPLTNGSTEVVWSSALAPQTAQLTHITPPADIAVAFGVCAPGAAGLRDAVVEARWIADALRTSTSTRVWTYDQHGVLALMATDPDACRRFVRHTLAGLSGGSPRMQLMRETLLAYLDHQGSRNAAAQQLNIAATTVAYRVRQAQQLLGPHATDNRTALIVALMLAIHYPQLAE